MSVKPFLAMIKVMNDGTKLLCWSFARYEDLRALDGGKDGLEVVKAVLRHADHLLLPGRTLLLEVKSCLTE